jgi:uncharacterized HAD superfamily protein
MENKLKIGIDLDDIVWKFREPFIEYYNNRFGTDYEIQNYPSYSLRKFLNIPVEEMFNLFNDFYDFEKIKLPLVDGIEKRINYLKKNFEMVFITTRPERTEEKTMKRIKSIFGDNNYETHFLSDNNFQKIKTKGEFCLDRGIKYMVDDHLDNAESCADYGINCFLLDFPWNQKKNLPSNIIRVYNWKDITEKLEDFRNGN